MSICSKIAKWIYFDVQLIEQTHNATMLSSNSRDQLYNFNFRTKKKTIDFDAHHSNENGFANISISF